MSLHDIGVASGSRWCLSETRLRRADLNRSPASGPQRLQVLNRTEPARNLAEKTHQAHCFLQRDPLAISRTRNEESLEEISLYEYLVSNPIKRLDPSGKAPCPYLWGKAGGWIDCIDMLDPEWWMQYMAESLQSRCEACAKFCSSLRCGCGCEKVLWCKTYVEMVPPGHPDNICPSVQMWIYAWECGCDCVPSAGPPFSINGM
jgi:hypothetical protein